ncbi:DUF3566 domain-containing protein [Pseudoclavibacter soli]|uniref:DUF3566 domain-containing protein n=1 Tax=Pseudoclavibacter soli TaxID=452623 RepID=UPI0003F599B1|nr:DUF3566 domain-containing protein [Pseudoclavibacter soli]
MNSTAQRLTGKSSDGGRRLVHLRLVNINVLSAAKVSLLVSLGLAIAGIVVAFVLWLLIAQLGLFAPINELFATTTSDGAENIAKIFSFGTVLGLAVLGGIVVVIFGTLVGALFAVIYNAVTRVVGGLKLTFTNAK